MRSPCACAASTGRGAASSSTRRAPRRLEAECSFMALDHGRRRRVRRVALIGMMVVLLAVVAGGVFFALDRGVGLASKDPDPVAPARTFLKAWSAGDLRAMYREVAPQARATTPYTGFSAAYRRGPAAAPRFLRGLPGGRGHGDAPHRPAHRPDAAARRRDRRACGRADAHLRTDQDHARDPG